MKAQPMLLQEDICPMDILHDKERLAQYIDGKYPDWVTQIKENGERALVMIRDGKIVNMFNRNNMPTFYLYPELRDIKFPFNVGIIDAEVVMLGSDSKSHFYNEKDKEGKIVQAGIQIRSRALKDCDTVKQNPVTLVAFDVLMIDNVTYLSKSYEQRYKVLQNNIPKDRLIKVAENFSFKEAWRKVINRDLEGVVLKKPLSLYEMGKRSQNYVKLKNYKVTTVTVETAEQNDKGIRITGKATINGKEITVECQIPSADYIEQKQQIDIKYIELVGDKLIQPTKISLKRQVV